MCVCVCVCVCVSVVFAFFVCWMDCYCLFPTPPHRKTMSQLVKMQKVVSYYSVIHVVHQTRDVRIVLWRCRVDVGLVGACESVRGSVWMHVRV